MHAQKPPQSSVRSLLPITIPLYLPALWDDCSVGTHMIDTVDRICSRPRNVTLIFYWQYSHELRWDRYGDIMTRSMMMMVVVLWNFGCANLQICGVCVPTPSLICLFGEPHGAWGLKSSYEAPLARALWLVVMCKFCPFIDSKAARWACSGWRELT